MASHQKAACAKAPDRPPAAEVGDPQEAAEVCARIWGLYCPAAPDRYEQPWEGIARDLWGQLAGALAPEEALGVAGPASRLGAAACADALRCGAPGAYRVAAQLMGFARSVSPRAAPAEAPEKTGRIVPGLPLEYELLAY